MCESCCCRRKISSGLSDLRPLRLPAIESQRLPAIAVESHQPSGLSGLTGRWGLIWGGRGNETYLIFCWEGRWGRIWGRGGPWQ